MFEVCALTYKDGNKVRAIHADKVTLNCVMFQEKDDRWLCYMSVHVCVENLIIL